MRRCNRLRTIQRVGTRDPTKDVRIIETSDLVRIVPLYLFNIMLDLQSDFDSLRLFHCHLALAPIAGGRMGKIRVSLGVRDCLYISISSLHSLSFPVIALETAPSKNFEWYARSIDQPHYLHRWLLIATCSTRDPGCFILGSAHNIFQPSSSQRYHRM